MSTENVPPPPEDRFYQTVVELTQLIHDLVSGAYDKGYEIVNPGLVQMGGIILSGYNKMKIIQTFIKYSHPHWDEIRNHNESFFDDHASSIFGDLPLNNVNAFKALFTLRDKHGHHVIIKDDRDAIWDFFQTLIIIAIKYIHQGRRPVQRIDNKGKPKCMYLAHFFDDVCIERHAKEMKIHLEFKPET